MTAHEHDISKDIRGYLIIGGSLLFLTIVTVAVSYLKVSLVAAVTIALIIATFKASLVACYFMHLISERSLIYAILIFTVIFIAGLPLFLLVGERDVITGTVPTSVAGDTTKTEKSPTMAPAHH